MGTNQKDQNKTFHSHQMLFRGGLFFITSAPQGFFNVFYDFCTMG